MPAVVWCAVGFVAGDLAGLLFSGPAWALAPLAAAAGVMAWRREARAAVALTAAAAGLAWGAAAAGRAARDCRARWREGERVALIVGLWDLAPPGGASKTSVLWPAACAGRVTVAWPRGEEPPASAAVLVGTWHRSAARVASRWPARPERLGRVVARRVRPLALGAGPRAALRLSAERALLRLFGPARASLAAALTVGTGDQLDAEVHRRFARAGIAHILAISGLHVGILAAALLLVLGLARVGEGARRPAATLLVAAYVGLLGCPPPAVRAAGLLALWCLARLRQRPVVPFAPLAATALAVAALDPFAVVEAGPWLSFAGAWGCVTAARGWSVLRREHSLPRNRRVAGTLSVAAISGGATLATAPLSALAFGTMAPAALVSNVLAVPLAGLLVPALALTLVLAAVLPAAAPLVAGAAAAGLDAMDAVARLAGALPLASVPFERQVLAAAVLAAIGLVVLRPLPGTGRGAARRALALRAATAGALAACAAAWWPLVPRGASGYRPGWLALHFLAVGEGDALALATPAGRWIVVDGGPRVLGFDAGVSVVTPYLRAGGVGRLAVAVASHGDADHLGGLPALVRAFRPELVLEPGLPLATTLYRRFLAAAAEAGSRWHPARAGDSVAVDGVVLRVWHPDSAWLERGFPVNESSVVLTVEYGAFRAVLPGDAGLAMESASGVAGRIGPATVLKVAHHGSRSATGPGWLAALAPRVCVVSVGPNRYGEPDAGVMAALGRSGCEVYRTDAGGTVTVETDGTAVRVRAGPRETAFTLTREGP
ncbi:MAG TPA: ComEC/Rec2 family competence protein [Gemmatimonadales bacterium]|nr:ComEC/Rec2 family competence protein [Gemmatimonadales bacterium]